MRNRSRVKEEGFLWVPGSDGMTIMAGKARQLEWVSLWLQKLANGGPCHGDDQEAES